MLTWNLDGKGKVKIQKSKTKRLKIPQMPKNIEFRPDPDQKSAMQVQNSGFCPIPRIATSKG